MKKLILSLICVVLCTTGIFAAAITSKVVTGNWNDGANWVGEVAPASTDDVILVAGATITLTANADCKTITFPTTGNGNATLVLDGFTLSVTGTVTVGVAGTASTTNWLNIGAGTMSCTDLSINGASATTKISKVSITTGTLTVNGTFSPGDNNNDQQKIMEVGAGGTLVFNGLVNKAKFKFTLNAASTVKYLKVGDKVIHSLESGFTSGYGNLVLGGGGNTTMNWTSGITIATSLTLDGTVFQLGGNTLTINNSATINAGVSNPFSSTNMIETNGTGTLSVKSATTAHYQRTYPIGYGVYSPVVISNLAATLGGTSVLNIKVTNYKHPSVSNNFLKRYWTFSSTAITAITTLDGYMQYAETDVKGSESNLTTIGRYASSAWTNGGALNTTDNKIPFFGTVIAADWTAAGSADFIAPAIPTYTVGGANADFTSLKNCFDFINIGGTGINYNLQLIGNTTETASASLIKTGITVNIYPTVTGCSIAGSLNAALISIANPNNLTIDGRLHDNTGAITGSTPDLIIENTDATGVSATTISISGTSASNTVTYCNIKGSSSTTGVLAISAINGSNNTNNIISYNKFTASSGGRPAFVCILAAGTYGTKVQNNNFENVLKSNGIRVNNSLINGDISGNSFYETDPFTPTANITYISLNGNNGGSINTSISNNYIGGSAPQCEGTLTTTGSFNFTCTAIGITNFRISGLTVNNNTIKNISWTNSGTAEFIGIYHDGNTSTSGTDAMNYITANLITNIAYSNSAAATTITGIYQKGKNFTISNNIISLSPNAIATIYGIREALGSYLAFNIANIYNNTVYIGGTPTSGSSASYAIHSNANTSNRDFRNNIFYNARSGGSGKHYAVFLNYSTMATGSATFTCNYNDYYVTGITGKMLGRVGTSDKADLAAFASATGGTGQDVNSSSADPGITPGSTPESFKGTVALTGVDLSALIGNKDFAGDTRKTLTQMGAFFVPSILSVSTDKNINEFSLTTSSQIEVGAGATLTLNQAMGTEISKIVVKPTGKISLGSNTITATNGVVLQSDATGTATLTGEAAVTNATVQQYVTAGRNWYVSPSVTAAGYTTLSRGTSVVEWNETTKAWDTKSSGTLIAGKGYIQVATSTPSVTGTTGTVNFTGTTNAGNVTTPSLTRTGSVATSGFNLVGNPYPSYLRWSGLNSVKKGSIEGENRNTGVGSSFWYRTKRNGDDAYIFVTHNGTSGYTIPSGVANTTITGIIPPMQAFWVKVNDGSSPTTMTFTNDMRLHADNAENKFKAPKNDERQRLRLQLANGTDTDEALIYFDAAAVNEFDNYDSPKMMNNSTAMPDLYSKAGTERLVINGLTEVTDNMTLPLGFTLKAAATGLKLKVSEISNFAEGTKVYLVDSEKSTQTELLPEAEYSFDISAATTYNESRFSLLFRAPSSPNAVNTVEKLNAQVFVNAANQITIVAPEKSNYAIYNAMGQFIEGGVTTSNYQTSNIKLSNGVYVVKVGSYSTRVIVK